MMIARNNAVMMPVILYRMIIAGPDVSHVDGEKDGGDEVKMTLTCIRTVPAAWTRILGMGIGPRHGVRHFADDGRGFVRGRSQLPSDDLRRERVDEGEDVGILVVRSVVDRVVAMVGFEAVQDDRRQPMRGGDSVGDRLTGSEFPLVGGIVAGNKGDRVRVQRAGRRGVHWH